MLPTFVVTGGTVGCRYDNLNMLYTFTIHSTIYDKIFLFHLETLNNVYPDESLLEINYGLNIYFQGILW